MSTDRTAAVCERVMVTDEPRTGAFEDFFMAEFPRLVTMLTAWTGDRQTAEDLAQEALVQAESDWNRVAVLDSPGTWVRRVALNRSLNERRRRGRERGAVGRLTTVRFDASCDVGEVDDDVVWAAVRVLPLAQRQAVVLRYVDDLPLTQIAEVMGCREGTVKTHLQRGRTALGDLLGRTRRAETD
jgi:RNA polymerase sigma-70 factor (ECF subfamily)